MPNTRIKTPMPALAPAQPHAKFCFFGGALLVGGQSFLADLLPTYRQPPFHIVAATPVSETMVLTTLTASSSSSETATEGRGGTGS